MQADHGIPRCLTQASPTNDASMGGHHPPDNRGNKKVQQSAALELELELRAWWPRAPSILQAVRVGNPPTDRATIVVRLSVLY